MRDSRGTSEERKQATKKGRVLQSAAVPGIIRIFDSSALIRMNRSKMWRDTVTDKRDAGEEGMTQEGMSAE